MVKSGLIVCTYTGKLNEQEYELKHGTLVTSLPFLADAIDVSDTENLEILLLVPHCLVRGRELGNPYDMIERVREDVRLAVRSSKLNDQPLDKLFREKYGKSIMSVLRIFPVECAGSHTIDGKIVEFEGDLLWMSLRIMLAIIDEVRGMPPERVILLDLTGGGWYQAPVFVAASLASQFIPHTIVDFQCWDGVKLPSLKSEHARGRPLRGISELFVVSRVLSSISRGTPEGAVEIVPSLLDSLRQTDFGSEIADKFLLLIGIVCGLKLPVLPMAHLAMLDLISADLPKISDPMDIKMKVNVLRYETWTIRYSYSASGRELENPLEGYFLTMITLARERLVDLGLVPSREEFEFKIPGTGRKVKLVDMSWDWIGSIADFLESVDAIPQLITLCSQSGPLLDPCKELLGEIKTSLPRYDELLEMMEEDKPLIIPEVYVSKLPEQEKREELLKKFRAVINEPDLLLKERERLMACSGLVPPVVYLIYKAERGLELLYIRELVEELLKQDSLLTLCKVGETLTS